MLAKAMTAVLLAGLIVGCGGSSDPAPKSSSDGSSTTRQTTPAADSKLVGEWQRLTRCDELVKGLTRAGLGSSAAKQVAEDGWIPGVTNVEQLKDPRHPCDGAAPRLHSHFFTADGLFGSRDENGEQVDDGTYTLPDGGTVKIGEVTFHFAIDDNQLRLTPVLPACATDGCFDAVWAVSVALSGHPWKRIS